MAENKRIGLGFLKNDWVITLTATLIGVFMALYLNETVTSGKLENQKSIATENILAEIASNKEKIEEVIDDHVQFLDIVQFVGDYSGKQEEGLIAPPDSLNRFRQKYPDIFLVADSTKIDDDRYEYHGEINTNFTLAQFDLSTLAWDTLKNSGISSAYGFDCLLQLQSAYNLILKISALNEELLDYFFSPEEIFENEQFISRLKFLIDLERGFVENYESIEKGLNECE